MKTLVASLALGLCIPAAGQSDDVGCLTVRQREEIAEKARLLTSSTELKNKASRFVDAKKSLAEASLAHGACTQKNPRVELCDSEAALLKVAEGRYAIADRELGQQVAEIQAQADRMRAAHPDCR